MAGRRQVTEYQTTQMTAAQRHRLRVRLCDHPLAGLYANFLIDSLGRPTWLCRRCGTILVVDHRGLRRPRDRRRR
jgi:hypothetical protein